MISIEDSCLSEKKKTYKFDVNLGDDSTQLEVYEKCAKRTISDFLNGINGTIFAYGQSGSGKTYSMMGPGEVVGALAADFTNVSPDIKNKFGITPRAVEEIYEAKARMEMQGDTCKVQVSYIEIYNEQLKCLLSGEENLKICSNGEGFIIPKKTIRECPRPEDIFKTLVEGTKKREVKSTGLNEESSRSHSIFIIDFFHKDLGGVERKSILNLVDLAGSERVSLIVLC